MPIPDGVEVMELEGKWLVPGFIDTHMHFWESGRTWTSPVFQIDLQGYVSYEEETAFMKERVPYTLEEGKRADILILNENPLESIKNFIKIDQVFINGELIDRAVLEENTCN